MSFGGYSGDASFYSAIELAVKATGQQGVTDLEAKLNSLTGQIAAYQASLAAGLPLNNQARKDLQDLVAQTRELTEAVAAAQRVQAGLPAQMQGISEASKRMGYAAQNAAYAFQDMRYGIAAISNNIGPLVSSLASAFPAIGKLTAGIGGPAGAAAVIQSLVVAIELLWTNESFRNTMTRMAKDLDLIKDPLRDATDSLEGLKEKIAAINDKPLKVQADYDAMRKLNEEVEKQNRLLEEWKSLKESRSSDQEKAHKSVAEGIKEGGGGSELEKALMEISKERGTFGAGSEIHGKILEQEEKIRSYAGAVDTTGPGGMFARTRVKYIQAEIDRLKNEMEDEQRAKIAEMTGLKAGEGSRKQFEDIINDPRNAEAFRRHNIDLYRLGAGVEMAAPDRLHEADRRKYAEEQEKKNKAAIDKRADDEDKVRRQVDAAKAKRLAEAEADVNKRIGQGVGGNVAGVDDRLEKAIHDAIEGGATREAAIGAERGGLIHTLRGRGVEEDIVGDVAAKILEKAADRAQNLLQEGGKTKLDLKKEADQRKEEAARAKAKAERDKEVGKVDQAFTGRAMAMMAANDLAMAQHAPVVRSKKEEDLAIASGQPYSLPPEVLARRIDQKTAYDLRRSGKDPGLAPDITEKAAESYGTRRAEALARTPTPDPTRAMALYGDQMGQNMARQSQAIAALIDVLAGLTAQNMTQGNAINQNITKINNLGQNMQRNGNRRPSMMPTVGN